MTVLNSHMYLPKDIDENVTNRENTHLITKIENKSP